MGERNDFNQDVRLELEELELIGVTVDPAVMRATLDDLEQYENMGVTGCADLLIQLHG